MHLEVKCHTSTLSIRALWKHWSGPRTVVVRATDQSVQIAHLRVKRCGIVEAGPNADHEAEVRAVQLGDHASRVGVQAAVPLRTPAEIAPVAPVLKENRIWV